MSPCIKRFCDPRGPSKATPQIPKISEHFQGKVRLHPYICLTLNISKRLWTSNALTHQVFYLTPVKTPAHILQLLSRHKPPLYPITPATQHYCYKQSCRRDLLPDGTQVVHPHNNSTACTVTKERSLTGRYNVTHLRCALHNSAFWAFHIWALRSPLVDSANSTSHSHLHVNFLVRIVSHELKVF
jgi:hypothetical protein